jgi:hypothetical protein
VVTVFVLPVGTATLVTVPAGEALVAVPAVAVPEQARLSRPNPARSALSRSRPVIPVGPGLGTLAVGKYRRPPVCIFDRGQVRARALERTPRLFRHRRSSAPEHACGSDTAPSAVSPPAANGAAPEPEGCHFRVMSLAWANAGAAGSVM